MMRRFVLAVVVMLGWAAPAAAQLGTVPTVFAPQTTISSSAVNALFADIYSRAVNRGGGVLTGVLTTVGVEPTVDGASPLGGASKRWATVYGVNADFSGVVTIGSITCTGCVTSTNVLNGTLLDADINASAAIALSKLASTGDLGTAVTIGSAYIYRAGGTDVPIADGGTGASTQATARTNLGLAIGSDVQAYSATLAALAALAVTDNNIIVGNGSTWVAESGATARTSLGVAIGTDVQAYNAALASIAGLTTAADRMIYTTASNTYAVTPLTAFGRSVLDDGDAATARTTLELVIGTHVQAYDAELAALAGLTSAADTLPYFTGSGTAAVATLTSFGRSLTAAANAAAGRTALALSSTDNPQFATLELGAASDTTLSRVSAGVLAVEGVTLVRDGTSPSFVGPTITSGGIVITANTPGITASTLYSPDGISLYFNGALMALSAGTITGSGTATYVPYFTSSDIVASSSSFTFDSATGALTATRFLSGTGGAVGTPSYTFTGDLNTGLWSPAADTLALSTGGTEQLRITSTGHVQPGSNDGGQLGVSGTAWSDLFLASGGVVNFNNGDVTVTHSSNVLTFAGASSGYVFNDGDVTVNRSTNGPMFLDIKNGTTGTAASARARLFVDGNDQIALAAFSSSFTTSGLAIASSGLLNINSSGGLSLAASHPSGDVRIYSGGTLAATFGASQAATFTGDLSLAATKKLYLDGGGDTYISESSANAMDFYVGGTRHLRVVNGYFEAPPVYNQTTASAANVYVQSDGTMLRSTSSLRYKHEIATLETTDALTAVMAMRPITYRGKTDKDQRRYVGFVAEEMATIAPLLATYDEGGESGTPNYVTYDRVTAYLVAVVQQQQAEINALKAQLTRRQ